MTVLIRDGDVWVERVVRDNQAILSLVLPGLEVRVAELWVDAEDDDAEGNG